LAGYSSAKDCDQIIEAAKRGEVEIVVSAFAEIEVAKLDDPNAEAIIREFFGRPYVIRAALEIGVAEIARELLRKHRGLKPGDAVHVATALHYDVPVLETYDDDDLIPLNGKVSKSGHPPLTIRHPVYEGQTRLIP